MATHEKPSSAGSDLDALIHSLEFENQQYVKMIEKENQRNLYLESQEEEKLSEVTELKSQITSLEADTKNNHKQLVHNKNTLESLKKSKCVLQAHRDALSKHLEKKQFENNEQRCELEDTVQMYEKTWKDYEGQYKSLALYQNLREKEDRLAESQAEQSKWQQKKNELKGKIQAAKEKKVSIARKKEELLSAVREKEHLQAKLKEIREKNMQAAVTSMDSAKESECSEMDTSEKDHSEEITENDITLAGERSADCRPTLPEDEKDDLSSEHSAKLLHKRGPSISLSSETDPEQNVCNGEAISVLCQSGMAEERMEEGAPPVTDKVRHKDVTKLSNTNAARAVCSGLMLKKSAQMTDTPKVPLSVPTVSVPIIRNEIAQRHVYSRTTNNAAKITVPYINLPKPVALSAPRRVPTVQSAVSSLLSGSRSDTRNSQGPPAPKIALPRTPLLPPLLSSVPSSTFSQPLKPDNASKKMTPRVASNHVSLPFSTAPVPNAVKEQVQSFIAKPLMSAPSLPITASIYGYRHSCPLKPIYKPLTSCSSEPCPVTRTVSVTPHIATSGAGDAPPLLCGAGKANSGGDTTDGERSEMSDLIQEEEMESDIDGGALSQAFSSQEFSRGSSQGQSNAFSPFDLAKHKLMLEEINDNEEDSFNFKQQPLFSTDNMMIEDSSACNAARSNSSVFNMTFVNPLPDATEPAMGSLYRDATHASVSGPSNSTRPAVANREERSGSFFSFESMDTGETSEGLSLLSVFGQSSKEPEVEPAFSFDFGTTSADVNNTSGFSFSFGGTPTDGQGTSGSMFTLF